MKQSEYDYSKGLQAYRSFKFPTNPGTYLWSRKTLELIRRRNLPFPLSRYYTTENEAKALYKALCEYEPCWIDRSHETLKGHPPVFWLPTHFRGVELQLVVVKGDWWKIDCLTDYFTEYARIRATKIYSQSIIDAFYDDDCMRTLLSKVREEITSTKHFRNLIFREFREVANFRPTRARALVNRILNGDTYGKRWLDICSGWGDRLLAACSLNMDYFGFDPNTELTQGYNEIIEFCASNQTQKIINAPFEIEESIELIKTEIETNGKFDICLTSPPFYTIEQYQGTNQSISTYPKLNKWIAKFLLKSLYVAWQSLKEGGYLALNIANISDCDIVSPTLLCIEEFFEGSSWEGIITFSGRGTQDVPGILYVWQKLSKGDRVLWDGPKPLPLQDSFPEIYKPWMKILDTIKM